MFDTLYHRLKVEMRRCYNDLFSELSRYQDELAQRVFNAMMKEKELANDIHSIAELFDVTIPSYISRYSGNVMLSVKDLDSFNFTILMYKHYDNNTTVYTEVDVTRPFDYIEKDEQDIAMSDKLDAMLHLDNVLRVEDEYSFEQLKKEYVLSFGEQDEVVSPKKAFQLLKEAFNKTRRCHDDVFDYAAIL